MDTRNMQFGYRCLSCHIARDFGAAKLRSEIEAGKHARKYDWHSVELTATVVYHTFTARDNVAQLPDAESPPF